MASDSTFHGFLRTDMARFFHSAALDTARIQENIADSQEHLYDIHGQTRINYAAESPVLHSASNLLGQGSYIISFGPFIGTRTKEGFSPALFCMVNASKENLSQMGTGTLLMNLRPDGVPLAANPFIVPITSSTDWNEVSISSSVASWYRFQISSSCVYLPSDKEPSSFGSLPTRTSASFASSNASAPQNLYWVDLYVRQQDTDANRRISFIKVFGFYAREVLPFP